MSDERNWNNRPSAREIKKRKELREENTIDDKTLIKEKAVLIKFTDPKSVWYITFNTKYGLSECEYYPKSRKWKKKLGKASGHGATTMMKYFKPLKETK